MSIQLEMYGADESIVEEFRENDGEVELRYKTFTPVMDDNGLISFNISELDSETLFSTEETNEQLFW